MDPIQEVNLPPILPQNQIQPFQAIIIVKFHNLGIVEIRVAYIHQEVEEIVGPLLITQII